LLPALVPGSAKLFKLVEYPSTSVGSDAKAKPALRSAFGGATLRFLFAQGFAYTEELNSLQRTFLQRTAKRGFGDGPPFGRTQRLRRCACGA
jgi:hypothetical protein